MGEEKKVTRKKIEATGTMNKYMADYFYELDRASISGDKKIAWCTSVGPAELLLSMDFLVYYPENHGALLGTSRLASEVIPNANALGFSPDICSYLTSDIGAYVKGITPLSKAFEGIESVPKPDVLVFNTNQCRDVKDWFAWYSRELNIPSLGIHTHRNPTDIDENVVNSIAIQMEDLVEPLEEISGNKFDKEEFKRVVALSRECSELWKEVLETASAHPSPFTFFDGTIHMGPAVVLRGTQQAVDYYKLLLKELKERVKNNDGAVEDEQFRLYWEGMPVWGRLRAHSELFAGLKACVLASTYCNSWIFTDFDPEDPFTSMAKAYSELFITKSDEAKEKYMKRMIDFFKIDGVIYHDAKTCPNNSNNRYGMPQRLEKETGVPSLTINGDLNDLRLISDEQTKTNVEAFIEQLEENTM
ncbi:MAG: 2-hydroxyacyl-CoA dehydratase [Ignavibacterium sp.]|nr:MAG: 2-hydroxyacyl-CoA dehydratase [Ignavibacterium sp.]